MGVQIDNWLRLHVRRCIYAHLLFAPSSYKLFTQRSSTTARIVVWFLMPLLRRIVQRWVGCHKPGEKEQSLRVIDSMFREVAGALADGRHHICESKFTATDLAFAALGGPMVAPPESGTWSVALNECPFDLAPAMRRLQVTPAGQVIFVVDVDGLLKCWDAVTY